MFTLRYSKLSSSAKRVVVMMSILGILTAIGFPLYVIAQRPPVEEVRPVQQIIPPSRPDQSSSQPAEVDNESGEPQAPEDQESSRAMTREEILARARDRAAQEAAASAPEQSQQPEPSRPPEQPEPSRVPEQPAQSQPSSNSVSAPPESSQSVSSQSVSSQSVSSQAVSSQSASSQAESSQPASSQPAQPDAAAIAAEAIRQSQENARQVEEAARIAAEEARQQAEANRVAHTFKFNPADYSENKGGYFDKRDGSRTIVASAFPSGAFVSSASIRYNWQGSEQNAIQYNLENGSVVIEVIFW